MRQPGPAAPSPARSQLRPQQGSALREPPAAAEPPQGLSLAEAGGNQMFLSLLGRTAVQPKLRSPARGDRFEHEADVAAAVVTGAGYGEGRIASLTPLPGGPVIQRKCAQCEEEEEEQADSDSGEGGRTGSQEGAPETPAAAAVATTSQVETPSPTSPAAAAPEASTPVPGLLVDDTVEDLGPTQMKKTDFLDALRPEVCAAVDRGLAGTGRSSDGCPHVEYWFTHLAGKDASFIERGIQRYAPEARAARSAGEYIGAVADRVQESTEVWAQTGQVEGIPEELAGAVALGMLVASGERGPAARVLFKARAGGARGRHTAAALRDRLGGGRPLPSRVRSGMENAFGTSFGSVRLHDDGRAAHLANEVNARAFTIGDHIAFANGEYRPGTIVGDALIAHELAHVVQQRGATDTLAPLERSGSGEAPLERDADRVAVGAVSALWGHATGELANLARNAVPRLRTGLSLQRCKSTPTPQKTPTLTFSVVKGPNQFDCGGFEWGARWSIKNATSSTNGWIVQKVELARDVKDCSDNPVAYNSKGLDPGWYPLWEAWQVRGGKVFIGRSADAHNADTYGSDPLGDSTKGSMKVTGTADYYDGLTLPSSFKVTSAAPTWALPATNTDPALTGGSGVVDHSLTATWDCCTATKTTKLKTSPPPK